MRLCRAAVADACLPVSIRALAGSQETSLCAKDAAAFTDGFRRNIRRQFFLLRMRHGRRLMMMLLTMAIYSDAH